MSTPGPRHQAALERFLAERPALCEELDHLNPLAAQAAGRTPQEYREEKLHEAFEAQAQEHGLFAWELTLQLTSRSPQEYESQRLEVHREVAQMAGMAWADYCALNDIDG